MWWTQILPYRLAILTILLTFWVVENESMDRKIRMFRSTSPVTSKDLIAYLKAMGYSVKGNHWLVGGKPVTGISVLIEKKVDANWHINCYAETEEKAHIMSIVFRNGKPLSDAKLMDKRTATQTFTVGDNMITRVIKFAGGLESTQVATFNDAEGTMSLSLKTKGSEATVLFKLDKKEMTEADFATGKFEFSEN